jgi:4-amino-4-deoxy-L-arabinose transferase-like glycosyltransferase
MTAPHDNRAARWLDPLLFVAILFLSAAILAASSAHTGIAVGESARLDAARAIGVWFDQIGLGESSLFAQPARDAAWSSVHAHVTLPTLLSALVWHVATSGFDLLGELSSLRSGHVLLAALSVPLLYALLAPALGRTVAWLSLPFLALVPRALHQASLADPGVVTVTGWLLVLVCYARGRHASRGQRRWASAAWMVASGVSVGAGVAASHGVLTVLLVVALHTLWMERRNLRAMVGEGWVPLPAVVLPMAVLAPATYFVSTPWLWHQSAERIRPVFVRAFSAGPDADAHGAWQGALSLVVSAPAVTLFAAALGLAVLVGPEQLRSWASDGRSSDGEIEALLVIGFVVAVGWPVVAPASLHASPPPWLVALPFLAGLAAVGLDRTLRELRSRVSGRALRMGLPLAAGMMLFGVALWQTVRQPSTRAAAFTPLAGGPAWVLSAPAGLRVHDGSVARELAPVIDDLGVSEVALFSPAIPDEVWLGMQRRGVMRTRVRMVRESGRADLQVLDPGGSEDRGKPIASVVRDGVELVRLIDARGR